MVRRFRWNLVKSEGYKDNASGNTGGSSNRKPNSIMFSVIKIMIKMHSTKLKMMSDQIFCLAKMIYITKFVIFYLKHDKNFHF